MSDHIADINEMVASPPLTGWAIHGVAAWYDVWVGGYWDRARRRLYLLPLPCLGFYIQFPPNVPAQRPPATDA